MSKLTKIAQQVQSNIAGFFGMELNSEQMIALHGGGEFTAVLTTRHRIASQRRSKRMGEVHE